MMMLSLLIGRLRSYWKKKQLQYILFVSENGEIVQGNDKKLLQFSVSDDESEPSDKPQEDEEEEEEDVLHKPSDNLEVASDESDFEVCFLKGKILQRYYMDVMLQADDAEEKQKDNRVITLKIIKKWQNDIQTDKSNKTIIELGHAFHAALRRISSAEEQDEEPAHFKVEGSLLLDDILKNNIYF